MLTPDHVADALRQLRDEMTLPGPNQSATLIYPMAADVLQSQRIIAVRLARILNEKANTP